MFVPQPAQCLAFQSRTYYRRSRARFGDGYVFPTLVAMGFGYAISETSLERPLIGRRWAWAGFFPVAIGAVVR